MSDTSTGLHFDAVSVLRSGVAVTHGVDLAVPPGQITALLGPNGAGKSSLVLAASGRLDATGSIRFDDQELIGRASDDIRRRGLAVVLEGHHVLAGLSVRDNLAAAASGVATRDIPRRVEQVFEVLPELGAISRRRAGNLSGGQQQMLAIGQGLICGPSVLIVDELSLGLAPIIVDRLLELLERLADDGLGVLLIEQFTSKALAASTTTHVLSGGRTTFSGPSETLRDDPSIIHDAYLGAPTGSRNR
ncbi:MAG: ABC transporter ATP-binding protein [Acidimicrobiales bacterium]